MAIETNAAERHSWSVRIEAIAALGFDFFLIVHYWGEVSAWTVQNLVLWGGWMCVAYPYWRFARTESKLNQLDSALNAWDGVAQAESVIATESVRAAMETQTSIVFALAVAFQWAFVHLHLH